MKFLNSIPTRCTLLAICLAGLMFQRQASAENPPSTEAKKAVAQARRAGYRACKRCGEESSRAADAIVRACRLIEGEGGPTRSAEIAEAVGLSAFYFSRAFKEQMGVTPQQYRRRVLAERAKTALPRPPRGTAQAGRPDPSSRRAHRVADPATARRGRPCGPARSAPGPWRRP